MLGVAVRRCALPESDRRRMLETGVLSGQQRAPHERHAQGTGQTPDSCLVRSSLFKYPCWVFVAHWRYIERLLRPGSQGASGFWIIRPGPRGGAAGSVGASQDAAERFSLPLRIFAATVVGDKAITP
jgi:hypothetical protein